MVCHYREMEWVDSEQTAARELVEYHVNRAILQ